MIFPPAVKGFIKKHVSKALLANLLFCCSPLLVFLLVICVLRVNPFRWVPFLNDEVGWYMQVNSVIEHGMPPGYTGYNETHAAVGRFGPWGGGLVCVMALFGKIFGWHWYSQLFMNVFFLVLANTVFCFFTRPDWRTAVKLTALNFASFLSIYYMFTGMSESTRFSMSIILAGLFFFLLKDENKGSRNYFVVLSAIAPVLLFLFINCYLLFAFLLPVYGYIWYKHLNPQRCRSLSFVALCVILPIFFALVCLFIQVKTSAPYPNNTLLSYLDQPNVISFLKTLKKVVAENYKHASLGYIFNSAKMRNGCISSYLMFYYLVLGIAALKLLVVWLTSKKLHLQILLSVYALSTFVVAFLVLYSTENPWTFVRGLNVALVFSLYLLCMLDWPKLQPVLFGLMFMQFFQFVTTIRDEMKWRYTGKVPWLGGGYNLFKRYDRIFSSKLVPSESDDPWDNTIAFYGKTFNFNCAISPGLSWNYIRDLHPVTKPRYIMTDRRRNWEFAGYRKTYSDDFVNIFEKVVQELPTVNETGGTK